MPPKKPPVKPVPAKPKVTPTQKPAVKSTVKSELQFFAYFFSGQKGRALKWRTLNKNPLYSKFLTIKKLHPKLIEQDFTRVDDKFVELNALFLVVFFKC